MSKAKSNKTQPSRTQRGKVHVRNAQPKHAYMYTRHNDKRHVRQPIANRNSVYRNHAHRNPAHLNSAYRISAPRNTAYRNSAHYHYNCMSHSTPQKGYRNHPPQQHKRHVSHPRKAFHPRINRLANVEYFYCLTKGHTSNVCYYRKLHLNMLPKDYNVTNQPRPRKVWVQKDV